MPKKWHEMITVYGYEILVPADVDTNEFITTIIKRKTSEFFRMYTLVSCISNGWDETQVDADDVFPIIGCELTDLREYQTVQQELEAFVTSTLLVEDICLVETPKLHSGIDVESIRPSDDVE